MTAYIVDAVRTVRGRGNDKGALKPLAPPALLARALTGLQERTKLDPARVPDGLFGCVTQTADQGANVGKLALIEAGWPDSVSGLTLNRYCASGLSAVTLAAAQAMVNDTLTVAGGVEMMSRVPMASDKGALTHDFGYIRRHDLVPIGIAADAVATMEGFDRAACDAYALESQRRAAAAQHHPSRLAVQAEVATLERDETPRPNTTAESLAALAPAFAEMGEKYGFNVVVQKRFGLDRIDHVHHAGNSPATADGASAVLVGSERAVRDAGLTPRARLLASADVGVDRVLALTGAVDATKLALARARLTVDDIDLFEVNESFAALMLHYLRHLNIGHDRLNVNGGAIALGHAMGSTGAALLGTALDELERRNGRRACIAICGAAGVAVAAVVERV